MYSSNKQRVFAILHAERDAYIRVTEHVKESYIVRVPRVPLPVEYRLRTGDYGINLQITKLEATLSTLKSGSD